jgi:hypothetical protein
MKLYHQNVFFDDIHTSIYFSNPWKKLLIENFSKNPNVILYIIKEKEIKPYKAKEIFLLLQNLKRDLDKLHFNKYDSIYLQASKTLSSYLMILLSLVENYVFFLGNLENEINLVKAKWIIVQRKLLNNPSVELIKEIQIEDEILYIYKTPESFFSSEFQFFYLSKGTTREVEWIGFTREQVIKNLARYDFLFKSYQYVFSLHSWNQDIGLWIELLLSMFKPFRLIFIHQNNSYPLQEIFKEFLSQHLVDIAIFYPVFFDTISSVDFKFLKNIDFGVITGGNLTYQQIEKLKNTGLRLGYFLQEVGFIFIGERGEIKRNYLGQQVFNNIEIDFFPDRELVLKSEIISKVRLKFHHIIYQNDFWLNTGDIVYTNNNKYFYQGRKRNFIQVDFWKWFNPYELEEILRYYFFTENIAILSDKNYKIKIFVDKNLILLQNEIISIIENYLKEHHIYNTIQLIFLGEEYFVKNPKGEILKKYFTIIPKMLQRL